jgi:predicted dehydrogenase
LSAREQSNPRAIRERRKLRAAALGAGYFGHFHALKLAAHPRVSLIAVVDPHPERAVEVAAECRAQALTSHEDLLGHVDLAVIATPAPSHAPLAREFLDAGAHVLIEKPLAMSLAEADALMRLARAKNRVIQGGHQERALLVQAGLLDIKERPTAIECVRKGPFTERNLEVGVVLDLMTHDLDLVHALNPANVVTVHAAGRSVKSAALDEVEAELTLSDGCRVRLAASRVAPARERSMRLQYAAGSIAIDFLARRIVNGTPHPLRDLFGSGEADDPLAFALDCFIRAIEEGAPPLVTAADARRALETALAIQATLAKEMAVG